MVSGRYEQKSLLSQSSLLPWWELGGSIFAERKHGNAKLTQMESVQMNTPPKTGILNLKLTGSLEDDFPFQRNDFQVLAALFFFFWGGGVYIYIYTLKKCNRFQTWQKITIFCGFLNGIICQIFKKKSPSCRHHQSPNISNLASLF